MSNKATISKKDERILHSKSGNRCALCKVILVDPNNPKAACIGENAHIYGEKPTAARYDPAKNEAFVNSEENLIFLCCNCHKKVDTDVGSYPPDTLFSLKSKHENWVVAKLEEGNVSYSFAELKVISDYIIASNTEMQHTQSYSLLKISEKIQKNSLQEFQKHITMGLSNIPIIEDFLNKYPDSNFAVKLTSIMAQKYKELKQSGQDSGDIFINLWDFASGNKTDFNYKAAGLGILTYFFEKCEVFEK